MSLDAGARIGEIIAEALAPGPASPPDLSTAEWESLWERARIHCLTPYLHERWRECGVIERIPPAIAERFAAARAQNTERNEGIALELAEICAALQKSGIRVLVLKGLSISQRYYRDAGLRVLYDLDLMIPEADGAAALRTMLSLGYTAYPTGRRAPRDDLGLLWRPRDYDWDAERVFDPQRPIFVELHTRLWEKNWHGFRLPYSIDPWQEHRCQRFAGLEVPAPPEETILVHLAVHYAFNALESNARLMHLLDVALLLRSSAPALNWDAVLRVIYDCHVERFCFLTFYLARKICRTEVPERVWDRLREATPASMIRWLFAEGIEAAHAMNLYKRNRSRIYHLHWAMTRDLREKASVLLYALRTPWEEAEGRSRFMAVARRTAVRLRHLLARNTQ
jgi:hypothetical protein